MVLASRSGGFGQTFGGAAGGCGQQHAMAGLLAELKYGTYSRRLAGARSSGQYGEAVGKRSNDCVTLLVGQGKATGTLYCLQGRLPIIAAGLEAIEPIVRLAQQPMQAAGDTDFAVVKGR